MTLRCPFSHRDASIAFFWTVYYSIFRTSQFPELHLKVKRNIISVGYRICLQWQRVTVSLRCAQWYCRLYSHIISSIFDLDHIKAESYDYTWIKWLHNLNQMSTNYIHICILKMYLKIQHQIRYRWGKYWATFSMFVQFLKGYVVSYLEFWLLPKFTWKMDDKRWNISLRLWPS